MHAVRHLAVALAGVAAAVLALLGLFPQSAQAQELRAGEVRYAGNARSFAYFVPDGPRPPEGWPLVLALHGYGGSGRNVLEQGRWQALARAEGFALLAPDGTLQHADRPASIFNNRRSWNSGPSTGSPASERGVDDIGFLRTLVTQFVAEHRLDKRRVYATGFSNGAAMAFRVGAELPDWVVAIAPVANALLVPVGELKPPVSLLLIWGDADPLNPIAGGSLQRDAGRVDRPSAATTLSQWAQALGCPGAASTTQPAPGLTRQSHRACAGGSRAESITVQGLGHQWPGGIEYLRHISGPGSTALDATAEIWAFFKELRR